MRSRKDSTKNGSAATNAAKRNFRGGLGEGRAIRFDRVTSRLPKSFKRAKVAAENLKGPTSAEAFDFEKGNGGRGGGARKPKLRAL